MMPDSDPVHMITIIPRGMAGGFTAYIPEDDDEFITKSYLENRLVSLLGGRVAEDLVLNEISTGASNDIERATKIARSMVETYGMSETLGTVKYGEDHENPFVGRDYGRSREYSEEIAAKIDQEVHDIIKKAYEKAEQLINENLDILARITDALLERETLSGKEFENIFLGKNFDGTEIAMEKSEKKYFEELEEEIAELPEEHDSI
ncbi:MAG: cell division protein FtsH, partial [Neofamilia sp.]